MNLERSLARLGGDISLLQDLAIFYLEDSEKLLQTLNEALESEDSKLAARSAHSLSGLSANFGADACASIAKAIEESCLANDFVSSRMLMSGLQTEVARLVDALKREVLPK